ncbi:MAG: taurine-transporting AtPase [Acidimicrobiales bacterium]|jgi:NitT/TauT family transport system ATP-binding protein|nr:taurine-transporting AtPase [Acidimicrobiales bacterium]
MRAPRSADPSQSVAPDQLMPSAMRVSVDGVTHAFRVGKPVLADVSLDVKKGEFVSIVGPSGGGKSTLLNIVAGVLQPAQGRVLYNGTEIHAPNREVGYVTQADRLLYWRTVEQNVRLPLQFRGVRKDAAAESVARVIKLVGLEGYERYYPSQLSGGMRQRVNLARSLVYEPDTLLMDEPFGSLDAYLRVRMQKELSDIVERLAPTVVFVTHDLSEAVALSDRILVLSGRPARVTSTVEVDIPRPRDVIAVRSSEEMRELLGVLWSAVELGYDTEERES